MLELYKKNREIVNYIIVGGLTTFVSLLVYYVGVLFFLNPHDNFQLQTANVLSWIAAVSFAYFANRKYVFNSESKNKIKEIFLFFESRIATLILDMIFMFCMVVLMGISDKIAKLLVQMLVMIGNYILSKFIVFRKK